MSDRLNRRDFLKLAGLLPLTLASPHWTRRLSGVGGQQNVIVIVFDAFSAYDISLYGYQRETMPNVARLAKRAIVYHNHFAGSNFTTSGTATLLTGTLPWTSRAIKQNGKVANAVITHNFFDAFPDYYRIAYSHNKWAFTLLNEFRREIDDLVARDKLLVASYDSFITALFSHDDDIASVSWTRDFKPDDGYAYSLFLSHLHAMLQNKQVAQLQQLFPRGLPSAGYGDSALLEQAMEWIESTVRTIPKPFVSYFHFLPPHAPYNAPLQFVDRFKGDRYRPPEKPVDAFGINRSEKFVTTSRMHYDQYILYVDREFGRLYDRLEQAGILDNTWLVLTSDHGEIFERGMKGHSVQALYQPLVHIPLLIFEPGRTAGMDIHTHTSAVDVLPTLAHVTDHAIPPWSEGTVLPPYSSSDADSNRSIYAVRAIWSDPAAPLTIASTMLVKGRYKLHYYFGYLDRLKVPDMVKVYDIESDPEELVDLALTEKDLTDQLLGDLKRKLAEVNQPYL
jgi:arylsulfatase A-like enzyme